MWANCKHVGTWQVGQGGLHLQRKSGTTCSPFKMALSIFHRGNKMEKFRKVSVEWLMVLEVLVAVLKTSRVRVSEWPYRKM